MFKELHFLWGFGLSTKRYSITLEFFKTCNISYRHVVIHELSSGQKLTRLPRDSSHTHHRMVTSAAWAIDADQDPVIQSNNSKWKSKANLFTGKYIYEIRGHP